MKLRLISAGTRMVTRRMNTSESVGCTNIWPMKPKVLLLWG